MEFRVLGPLEVAGECGAQLGGPKQRTLLGLLVLRANDPVSTDTLVEAMWDGHPPGSAAALVRTYVSRLRRILSAAGTGARLVGRAPGYLLEVDPDAVDALHFERLTRQARRHATAGQVEAASTTLTRALGLWRGDLLADLADRACFRPFAARLGDLRVAAVEDRIDADLALGRHADVVGELEELTARHPFRERLWGQRIVALYRSGRQADALAAYGTVSTTLVEHLGIAPGPELQKLEMDVLHQVPDLGWRPPPERSEAPSPAPGLPVAFAEGPESHDLAGRAAEQSRLDAALRDVREGSFRAVFVAGEPGIGKTALVAGCARRAYRQGAVVTLGRTDEDLGVPFQALRGAIRQSLAGAGAGRPAWLGNEPAAQLSRLVPEIHESRPAAIDASAEDGDIDRHRLFEAISDWVSCLASRGPAVVVLEDLHWADHATLLALRHLLRHPPSAGALVLMTYRNTELTATPGLASLVADARRDDFVSHVELAGLSDDEVVELLGSEVGRLDEAGRAFAERLNRRTGGNPLFIHETLRHLTEHGSLGAASRPSLGAPDLDALGVPTGISQVFVQRLRHLPEATTDVLRAASVVGQRFDVPVLSRMLGIGEVDVLQGLEPALACTLVRPATPPDGYAFSHALVRDAIFETIPLAERPGAHWRAGEAIASVGAPDAETHLEEVAWHLVAGAQAGAPQLAVSASVEAGRRAMAALAFEDAVDWFRAATGLVTRGPVDPDLAFDAWFGLGAAATAAGRWAEHQRDGYLQAARIARAQHWPRRFAQAVIGLTYRSLSADDRMGSMAARQGQPSEVQQLCDEALALVGDTAPAERALLLGLATVQAVRWGRSGDGHRLANLAAEVAGATDDATTHGGALLARCWILFGAPRPRELAETAERALVLPVGRETRTVLHALVLPGLVVASLQQGDRAGFEAARARVVAHPEVQRSLHMAGFLHMLDAGLAVASGRLDEAEKAIMSLGEDEWWVWRDTAGILSVAVSSERGQLDHVVTVAGALLAMEPDLAIPRAMLALAQARRGGAPAAASDVEELARSVRTKLHAQAPVWDVGILLALTAELAARLDAPNLARSVFPTLSAYSGQLLVTYLGTTILGAADRSIGQALLALGRPAEARERLQAAWALEQSFGADGLAAHSSYWLARAHAACGDDRPARELAGQVLVEAERRGMVALADDCRAMLG